MYFATKDIVEVHQILNLIIQDNSTLLCLSISGSNHHFTPQCSRQLGMHRQEVCHAPSSKLNLQHVPISQIESKANFEVLPDYNIALSRDTLKLQQ